MRGAKKRFSVLIVLLCAQPLQAQDTLYFYTGKTYGSEAVFNPINVLFNEGYGILQLDGWHRRITDYPYRLALSNVMRALGRPFETVSRYGVGRFLRSEIFPLSTRGSGGGQWVPNYQLHLIGGGMVSAALREWYQVHDIPHPALMSFLTVSTVHLLNETIENNEGNGANADAVADFYVFDIAGVLLYRSERVQRFFSRTLNLASWMAQPAFTWSTFTLQNNGQSYAVKWKFPFSEQLHFFYYFGMNNQVGLSYKRSDETAWSLGGGLHAKKLITLEAETQRKTVELAGTVGLFWDRNNALLASLIYSGAHENTWNLNVYPGVLRIGPVSPGFWIQGTRDGQVVFGINTRWVPGVSFRF
jgi:hypothetical protein